MAKNKGSPFEALRDLKKKLEVEEKEREEKARKAARESTRLTPQKTSPQKPERRLSDAELFANAMQGVQRLEADVIQKPRREIVVEPEEVTDPGMQELIDVVEGRAPLDFTASDEWVEGRARDCNRLQLTRLKNGEFAVEAHIDLHGLSRDDAKQAVSDFLMKAMGKGQRCVLIVCGRGLRSPGGIPVLKEALVSWLAHGKMSRKILAFCSAQVHDGGVGAIYVLLRKS